MRVLRDPNLGARVEVMAQQADKYGAHQTAERLRGVFELFDRPGSNVSDPDIIPHLLDSSLLWREMEFATRRKVERWYIARNVSTVLLLIFTFSVLYLAAITYLGWWPGGRISPLILSSGALVDFALFSFWSFCLGRIQWSKYRAKRVYTQLALELQDLTGRFLLRAIYERWSQPREIEDVFRHTANQLRETAQQLAATSSQTFGQLANKNEQALQQLVAMNQGVLGKMQTLNAEVEQQVHLFDATPSLENLRKDIAGFLANVGAYQNQLIQANNQLISAVRDITSINENHINIEQKLTAQFETLEKVQQAAIDRTEAIATAMSTIAQSVVNIVGRLAQQQQDSSGTVQKNLGWQAYLDRRGILREEER